MKLSFLFIPLSISILLFGCSANKNNMNPSKLINNETIDSKYYCVEDSDCRNSCSQGAVNRIWYAENMNRGEKCLDIKNVQEKENCLAQYIPECFDGCNGIHMGSPKCIINKCTAFKHNGIREDSCTGW